MPRPRLLRVLLLPLLAACGTLRLYDGPERPREQVAQVHELSDPIAFMGNSRAVVTSIDGREIGGHSEHTVELLPGPHALGVEGEAIGTPVRGTLDFTADAGGDYELWLSTGEHSGGAIVLHDTRDGRHLADTEPTPEQAQSARLDFEPGWHVVNWHLDAAQAGQLWVPGNESEQNWSESVSTGAQRAEGGEAAAVLDGQVELIRTLAARVKPPPVVTVTDSGPSYRVVTTALADGPYSVTCVRIQDGVIHRLSYNARTLSGFDLQAPRWQAAFLAAPLAFPGP